MKVFTSALLVCIGFILVSAKEKRLTVHIATWNVNERGPPGDLAKLLGQLPDDPAQRPDIIAVGLQEVTMSMGKAIKNYLLSDRWSRTIDNRLKTNNYIRVKSVSLIGIVLNVYVKLEHAWSLDGVESSYRKTGFGGVYGNKGGVIAKFNLYKQSFCIVNSHFHAHDEHLDDRIGDYQDIETERQDLCDRPSDYVFWMGDLNFRIADEPGYTAERIKGIIAKGQIPELVDKDQLLLAKKEGRIFNGYQEAPIRFNPTFKVIPSTGEYNTKRRPSWTDRVLYKSETNKGVTAILYKSIESYTNSDHIPVQAHFAIFADTERY